MEPLPISHDRLITYEIGQAQIFHLRPKNTLPTMNQSIGILSYAQDRSLSGIGRYTYELINVLLKSSIKLFILQAGNGNYYDTYRLVGAGLLPSLLTLGQVEISYIAKKHKLDVIHDPTGTYPLFLTRARKIVTIHDVIPYIYPETSTTLDWLIYRFWLPLAAPQVDAVITDSQNSKADLLRYLRLKDNKVTVIPGAANKHYHTVSPEQIQSVLIRYNISQPYILYVGAIEPRKNLLRLLQAYAKMRFDVPAAKLVMVGSRSKRFSNSVLNKVEELNLKSCVHFTGYVPEDDLPALYNGAELFVFPSLYEGFGLPVLEAMACGVPVITSDVSSLPEVAGNASLLVDPYNVDEIAANMYNVLVDKKLGEELRWRGLQRSKEFSWERTAQQTIQVYKKVLGEV